MTIAVVKSGSFTGVTYDDLELNSSIYDDHAAQGETLVYLESSLSNSGTDAVPVYRAPTAGETASTITAGDLPSTFSVNENTKLAGVEDNATADQDAAEVRALVASATNSNVYVDADKTKVDYITVSQAVDLDDIETKADSALQPTDTSGGANYASITLASTGFASLDGTYTEGANGRIVWDGTNYDYVHGGVFKFWYKDNGGGTWAIIACSDSDGVPSGAPWYAYTTTVDPSSLTGDTADLIPNASSQDFSILTSTAVQTWTGDYAPEAGGSVSYSSDAESFITMNGDTLQVKYGDVADGATDALVTASDVKATTDAIAADVTAIEAKTDHISVTQAVDLDTIESNLNASKGKTDHITVTQAVDLDQIETDVAASKVKTDNITVTQAVDLDDIETKANAALQPEDVTGATSYSTVTLTGTLFPVDLDGTYTETGFNGYLFFDGTHFDYFHGGNSKVYSKDNGGGVWSMVAINDDDGTPPGTWYAVLVAQDPALLSADVSDLITNVGSVSNDPITTSSTQVGSDYLPTAGGKIAYNAAEETYLEMNGDKLQAKVGTISEGSANKLVTAADVKANLTDREGVANGIAPLNSSGKIDNSYLSTDVMHYKGAYDASTNSPDLTGYSGDDGDVFIVYVAGSQNLPGFGGSHDLLAGDQLIWDAGGFTVLGADTTLDAASVKSLYESNADTNAFDDAAVAKLAGIEAGATGDQTEAEIVALYEGASDRNQFSDTEKSKLANLSNNPQGDYQRIIANPTITSATTIPTFASGGTVSYQVQSSDPQSLFKIVDDDGTGITLNAETGTMFGGSSAAAGSYTLVVVTASVFGQSAETNLSLTIS